MQEMRSATTSKPLDLSRYKKLKIKDLGYFDFNYKSERNKLIVNVERYIYYYDMFI